MVQTTCPKCKKLFDRGKELTCRDCYSKDYQLGILHSVCLEAAATLLRNNLGEVIPSTPSQVFELAKELYREGKNQKYYEWEPDETPKLD